MEAIDEATLEYSSPATSSNPLPTPTPGGRSSTKSPVAQQQESSQKIHYQCACLMNSGLMHMAQGAYPMAYEVCKKLTINK